MIAEIDREIMLIAQEECAEVIQAISKVFRFGPDNLHRGVMNRDHLAEEIGDLMCMFELMIDNGMVSQDAIQNAMSAKMSKLEQWSNIV